MLRPTASVFLVLVCCGEPMDDPEALGPICSETRCAEGLDNTIPYPGPCGAVFSPGPQTDVISAGCSYTYDSSGELTEVSSRYSADDGDSARGTTYYGSVRPNGDRVVRTEWLGPVGTCLIREWVFGEETIVETELDSEIDFDAPTVGCKESMPANSVIVSTHEAKGFRNTSSSCVNFDIRGSDTVLTDGDDTFTYSGPIQEGERIQTRTSSDGETVTVSLHYNAELQLVRRHGDGRVLSFEYDDAGHLIARRLHEEIVYRAQYDAGGNLVAEQRGALSSPWHSFDFYTYSCWNE